MRRRHFEPFVVFVVGIKIELDHDFAGVGSPKNGSAKPFPVMGLPHFHLFAFDGNDGVLGACGERDNRWQVD